MSKADLRTQAARIRREAARADPDAAARLEAHQPAILRSGRVALYRPMRDEIDPWRMDLSQVETALPVTPPKGSGAPLTFRLWSPGYPVERSAFGVEEPLADACEVIPDVLVVPLLAFDDRGGRLGWGQGHYDRTLHNLRARGRVVAIGLAYAAQRRDDLPLELHDEPLDAVLTESGYSLFRAIDAQRARRTRLRV